MAQHNTDYDKLRGSRATVWCLSIFVSTVAALQLLKFLLGTARIPAIQVSIMIMSELKWDILQD